MRRLGLLLASLAIASLLGATAAQATSQEDAVAAVQTFVAAVYASDHAGMCALMSVRMAEQSRGDSDSCAAALDEAADPRPLQDQLAAGLLEAGWQTALWLSDHRDGCFVSKSFPATKLAKAMHRTLTSVRVILGKGPLSARDKSWNTLIIDSARTSCHRVVLYDESDSGLILGLSSGNGPAAQPQAKVVGKGVPKPLPPAKPTLYVTTVGEVAVSADGTTFVELTLRSGGRSNPLTFRLVLENGAYRVDDVLGSLVGP